MLLACKRKYSYFSLESLFSVRMTCEVYAIFECVYGAMNVGSAAMVMMSLLMVANLD